MTGSAQVGVDAGGTFTDLVARANGSGFVVAKTLSTPATAVTATAQALDKAGVGGVGTVSSLTQRFDHRQPTRWCSGSAPPQAHSGLRDLLQIQRGGRPKSLQPDLARVSSTWCRATCAPRCASGSPPTGASCLEVNEDDVRAAVAAHLSDTASKRSRSFLFGSSTRRTSGARRRSSRDACRESSVSLSCEVMRADARVRAHEHDASINAYARAGARRYAPRPGGAAARRGLDGDVLLMQFERRRSARSRRGRAAGRPAAPGPAGGVIAEALGRASSRRAEPDHLRHGRHQLRRRRSSRRPTPPTTDRVDVDAADRSCPMVDIATIGAGGGSIAWLDAGGVLQVGPQSAGAVPGPACYGRGGTSRP